jgi:serine/threonine protein kinase
MGVSRSAFWAGGARAMWLLLRGPVGGGEAHAGYEPGGMMAGRPHVPPSTCSGTLWRECVHRDSAVLRPSPVGAAHRTPYYVSPEVVRGLKYNYKSDMWSLGCLLYELATGRSPFEAGNASLYEVCRLGGGVPCASIAS